MITLFEGSPQEIINMEKMLKFIGDVEIKDSDIEGEPLFDKQKKFDSMVFQRSYFVYPKGRSILSPLRIKFVYNMRELKAQVKSSGKDAGMLNQVILGKRVDGNSNDNKQTADAEQRTGFSQIQKQAQ